jgi:hypothetical protein
MSKGLFQTARSGYDAKTCDTRFRTIDSTKNTLKLFNIYTGQVSTTSPNYWNDVYISHNLGYQPYIEVYYNIVGKSVWKKAPILRTEEDEYGSPDIAEEVHIERESQNQIRVVFLSGNVTTGFGTEETFNYVCRIYINAWEGSWYE